MKEHVQLRFGVQKSSSFRECWSKLEQTWQFSSKHHILHVIDLILVKRLCYGDFSFYVGSFERQRSI